MAILVHAHKEAETEVVARYRFHTDTGADRFLVLDKLTGTIRPDDGRPDAVFRAAASRLARAWRDTATAPDHVVYSA